MKPDIIDIKYHEAPQFFRFRGEINEFEILYLCLDTIIIFMYNS